MRRTGLIKTTVLTTTTALLFAFTGHSTAAADDYNIPASKERFELRRNMVADKLNKALLPAMRNHNIDMWIVLDRENNDFGRKPVFQALKIAGAFRGRGCLVVELIGDIGLDRLLGCRRLILRCR